MDNMVKNLYAKTSQLRIASPLLGFTNFVVSLLFWPHVDFVMNETLT